MKKNKKGTSTLFLAIILSALILSLFPVLFVCLIIDEVFHDTFAEITVFEQFTVDAHEKGIRILAY